MMDRNCLPNGWILTAIGDITEPIAKVDPRQTPERKIVYLDISSIDNANHRVTEPKHYRGADAPSRARQQVRGGDVLFSTVRTYLENIAVVPDALDGQVASTGFSILRGAVGVSSTYVFYYTLTKGFLDALDVLQRGTSYPAVRDEDVRSQLIPLAPTAEQERIVAEIETQFTRLDAGVAALKRAQANLKRYKAAVLKAACEGRLVPQDPSDEPASELLARILAERRTKWEADLRAKGKDPAKARYDDPVPPDTDDLPALPDGWCWATVGDSVNWSLYGPRFSSDAYAESGVPVIRTTDINGSGKVDLSGVPRLALTDEQISKFRLEEGDLVVTRTGSIGRCAIFPGAGEPCIPGAYLIQFRLNPDVIRPKYLLIVLLSPSGQRQLVLGSTSVTQANINAPTIRAILLPLPPLAEQQQIIDEVDHRLSIAEDLEAVIDVNLMRAARLRQSILARAFAGELMPQDPSDEPASVLLERIRAQRDGQAGQPVARRRREATQVGSTAMHPRPLPATPRDDGPVVQLPLLADREVRGDDE